MFVVLISKVLTTRRCGWIQISLVSSDIAVVVVSCCYHRGGVRWRMGSRWMRQWMLFVDLSLPRRLDALKDIISITMAMVHHIGQTRADSLGPSTMLVELSFLPAARCRHYIDQVVDMA